MDFIDLKTQQQRIRADLDHRLNQVLNHGQYILGPEVVELELLLAEYVGTRHCISAASGTDALLLSLMALGVGPGDEVITTPFSFIATAEVIALLGAVPVFVDVDERTYNLDVAKVEAAVSDKTKALMPVSLYGQCADMDAFVALGRAHGIAVIEDGAQSFGGTYHGRRSCGLSTLGCTSFFPAKPLGCYGDGGACFTNDDGLATRLKELRNHGQDRRYHHPRLGINGRMDSMQAAVLLSKMSIFADEVRERDRIGRRYSEMLAGCDCVTPYIEPHNTSVYAQYTLQVPDRERFQRRLQEQGIPTSVHYPVTLDRQPGLESSCRVVGGLPVASRLAETVVSLPMHPYLAQDDQDRVVATLLALR